MDEGTEGERSCENLDIECWFGAHCGMQAGRQSAITRPCTRVQLLTDIVIECPQASDDFFPGYNARMVFLLTL